MISDDVQIMFIEMQQRLHKDRRGSKEKIRALTAYMKQAELEANLEMIGKTVLTDYDASHNVMVNMYKKILQKAVELDMDDADFMMTFVNSIRNISKKSTQT